MSDSDEDGHGPPVRAGTLVPWSENGKRNERIVDWLDSHEEERNCLFSFQRQGRSRKGVLRKLDCHQKMCKDILSIDEDASIRDGVKREISRYTQSLASHFKKFPHQYRRINSELGSSIVNRPFDTLGPAERDKVEDLLEFYHFPIWKRLHKYWRVMPDLNKYWRPQQVQSSARSGSASGATSRAPICIDIEASEDDSKKVVKSEAAPALLPPRKSGRERKRKRQDMDDDIPKNKATGSVKFEEDEPKTTGISSREEFQLRVETLAYKKQKLELEHEEKKLEHEGKKMDLQRLQLEAEMQRQRDEHEIKLFLLKK